MCEGVLKCVDVDIDEKETLNATVFICYIIGHLYILLCSQLA